MFGWGTSDFLGGVFSRKTGHLLTLFWMQVAGFLISSIYFLINFKSFDFSQVIRFIPILALCGFLEAIAYLFFFKGLEKGQISLVSPIGSSWPVLTLILGMIFLKEILLAHQIVAVILIISGVLLASINIEEIRQGKLTSSKGTKEGFLAMAGWGILFFLLTAPSRALGWFLSIFIIRFFAILFLIPFFINKTFYPSTDRRFYLIIFSIIGFIDVISFLAYTFGIQIEQVSIVAPLVAPFPLVTIILARIFLKERLTLNQVIGIVGALVGLILISI